MSSAGVSLTNLQYMLNTLQKLSGLQIGDYYKLSKSCFLMNVAGIYDGHYPSGFFPLYLFNV